MKIEIYGQHLTGNDEDGFDVDAWVAALTEKYDQIARNAYPQAEIVIKIDVQNACGYTRPVQVFGDEDNLITLRIEHAANELFDQRGQDFFA